MSSFFVNHQIEKHLPALQRTCQRHDVARLILFGSAALEPSDSGVRDYDFVVEFLPLPAGKRADAYFSLLEDLQQILDGPVDLVVSSAINNPFFKASIKASEQQLYAA